MQAETNKLVVHQISPAGSSRASILGEKKKTEFELKRSKQRICYNLHVRSFVLEKSLWDSNSMFLTSKSFKIGHF